MPPPRCPSCGRFLSDPFIRSVIGSAAPCPRCGTQLNEQHFPARAAEIAVPPPTDTRPVAADTPGTDVGGLGSIESDLGRGEGADESEPAGSPARVARDQPHGPGEPVRPWIEDEPTGPAVTGSPRPVELRIPPGSVPTGVEEPRSDPQRDSESTAEIELPSSEDETSSARAGSAPTSVRPPDLPPTAVRPPGERDVLDGWDADRGDVARTDAIREAVTPERTQAVALVLGAGVAGGLIGAAVGGRRRTWGAIIGTLSGAVAALIGTRTLDANDR